MGTFDLSILNGKVLQEGSNTQEFRGFLRTLETTGRLLLFVGVPKDSGLSVYQSWQERSLTQMIVKIQSSFEMRLRVGRIHCEPLWVILLSELWLLGS